MKKTLLALAVAGISTSALAAGNIYDNGTTSLNLKGEVDAFLSTKEADVKSGIVDKVAVSGGTVKADLDIDLWAKVQVDAQHKLNNDITLIGSFEIENGNGYGYGANDYNVVTDDLYVGALIGKNLSVAVGEVGDFGDSLDAITIDNTNEGYGYADDFLTSRESAGHGVAVKGKFDQLTVIADAYLDQDEDTDTAFGVSAQYAFNDMFTVGASFQDQGEKGGKEYDVMGVAARFNMNNLSVAANYVMEDENGRDIDGYGVAASYQINAARLYTSVGVADGDDDYEGNFFTLGADYAVSSNVSAFVEYAVKEDDLAGSLTVKEGVTEYTFDKDTQVVAGFYYTF